MLNETGMGGEVVRLSVFKHENTIRFQQLPFKYQIGNLWKLLKGIRWVSKDKVKLLVATSDETEDVAPNGKTSLSVEFLQAFGNEAMVVAVQLHTDHLLTAAG